MRVAGIVLFNPDLERLKENIGGVMPQVDMICCVDNCSDNIGNIENLICEYGTVHLIKNGSNKGVAAALNQIASFARHVGAEWVLTLDQDSIPQEGLIDRYENELQHLSHVGMLTCLRRDINTHAVEPKDASSVIDKRQTCITSGCYLNIAAWDDAGGFDEKMFIDYVDFDMCMTLHEHGYEIYLIPFLGIIHELGNSRIVSFLGHEEIIYGHTAFRKYYFVRNRLYYAKKHEKYLNKWRQYGGVIKYIMLVVLYEDNKKEKVKSMIHGVIDSKKMLETTGGGYRYYVIIACYNADFDNHEVPSLQFGGAA